MVGMDRRSTLWLKALLTAGAVLAMALLFQTVVNYRFASLFWCSYDPASHRLCYVNAGHPGVDHNDAGLVNVL